MLVPTHRSEYNHIYTEALPRKTSSLAAYEKKIIPCYGDEFHVSDKVCRKPEREMNEEPYLTHIVYFRALAIETLKPLILFFIYINMQIHKVIDFHLLFLLNPYTPSYSKFYH